ncbi:MAG: sporulation protein YunB [Christensenellales bacterium]
MPQTNNESEAKIPAKRRKSPRRRWKRALLLLVLMTLLILRVERNVTDVVLTLSQATARSLAIQALNEAASEMLGLGVHYADLMTVEKDDQGQVRLIQANTPEMNRLAAQASLLAQERLTAMGQKTVVVPLGSAIGLTLLAGAGPGIAVQILPVGSVQAAFSTDFTTAGINQTRHCVSSSRLRCKSSFRPVRKTCRPARRWRWRKASLSGKCRIPSPRAAATTASSTLRREGEWGIIERKSR